MKKLIILILALATMVSGAIFNVPGDYTLNEAATIAGAGDTFYITDDVTLSGTINCKSRQYFYSDLAVLPIINVGDFDGFYAGGDTVHLNGLHLRYNAILTSYRYLFRSAYGRHGHIIENCIVERNFNETSTSYGRGIYMEYSDANINSPVSIIRKTLFKGIYYSVYDYRCNKNIIIDSCSFDTANTALSPKGKLLNSIFSNFNEVTARYDSVKISNCAFYGCTGEPVSFDSYVGPKYDDTLEDLEFVGLKHTGPMLDGLQRGVIRKIIFRGNEVLYCIYGHGAYLEDATADVEFSNITIINSSIAMWQAAAYRTIWNKILGISPIDAPYGQGFLVYEGYGDTLKNSMFTVAPDFSTYPVIDTLNIKTGLLPIHMTDTTTFGFPKHKYLYLFDGEGARGPLTNPSNAVSSTNGFAVKCSLSADLHHNNLVMGFYPMINGLPNFIAKNTWFTGDTAVVRLEVSTDGVTYAIADSSVMVADMDSSFSAIGLSPETEYNYRFTVQVLSDGLTDIRDTTAVFTVTTQGVPQDDVFQKAPNLFPTVKTFVYLPGNLTGMDADSADVLAQWWVDHFDIFIGGSPDDLILAKKPNLAKVDYSIATTPTEYDTNGNSYQYMWEGIKNWVNLNYTNYEYPTAAEAFESCFLHTAVTDTFSFITTTDTFILQPYDAENPRRSRIPGPWESQSDWCANINSTVYRGFWLDTIAKLNISGFMWDVHNLPSSQINQLREFELDDYGDSLRSFTKLVADSLKKIPNKKYIGINSYRYDNDTTYEYMGLIDFVLREVAIGYYKDCYSTKQEIIATKNASDSGKTILLHHNPGFGEALGTFAAIDASLNQKQHLDRDRIAGLAVYLMARGESVYFYSYPGTHYAQDKRITSWFDAMAYDLGQPKGLYYVFDEGADPSYPSVNYQILARNYDKALVLVRPKSNWQSDIKFDSTSAVTHTLDGWYKPLSADGELGGAIQNITLKNWEGAILIPASAPNRPASWIRGLKGILRGIKRGIWR